MFMWVFLFSLLALLSQMSPTGALLGRRRGRRRRGGEAFGGALLGRPENKVFKPLWAEVSKILQRTGRQP